MYTSERVWGHMYLSPLPLSYGGGSKLTSQDLGAMRSQELAGQFCLPCCKNEVWIVGRGLMSEIQSLQTDSRGISQLTLGRSSKPSHRRRDKISETQPSSPSCLE